MMNLSEVRKLFLESSGRFDLYDSQDTVNDVFLINAACKYLDIRSPQPESYRWYKKDIPENTYRVTMQQLRAIKEVWISNDDGRTLLVRKPSTWIKREYGDNFEDADSGTPQYWTEELFRLSPEQSDLTQSNYSSDFSHNPYDVLFDSTFSLRGLLLYPKTDSQVTVEVLGMFFSEILANDSDVNYWTVYFPQLLVEAAVLCLEKLYRNREGYLTQESLVFNMLSEIEKDYVETEITGESVMEG